MSLELKIGKGKCQIYVEAHSYSDGLSILLHGGDKSHIGAVAISIPRQSLKEKRVTSCSTSILTITGHKDDIIAREMSETVCRSIKKTIVVVAGVHINRASSEDIKNVMSNCRKASKKLIELFNV